MKKNLIFLIKIPTIDISKWMELNSLFIVVTQKSEDTFISSLHHDKGHDNSSEIKDGHLLISCYSHGDTAWKSALNLIIKIKGKLLVFNATSDDERIEIGAPTSFCGIDKLLDSMKGK